MAVYNIFASADATIYSRYPLKNTGIDSILEVSVKNSQDGTRFLYRNPITENPYYTYDLAANGNYSTSDAYFPETDIRRSVLQFSDQDINKLKTFASQAKSGSYQANLQLFLATAQNLSTTYSLDVYPVSQSWCMGTGRYAQVPESRNGVSWNYTCAAGTSPVWAGYNFIWNNAALPTWETAYLYWDYISANTAPYFEWNNSNLPVWNATYLDWNFLQVPNSPYATSSGGSWINIEATQSFDYMSNKDINTDITPIVSAWFDNSIPNYGVIVKHPQAVEEDPNAFIDLKFFSVDTHTIYPPTIEFKWDDSYYFPQGGNFALSDQITVVLANNPGQFVQNEVYKMRIATRYTYPPRQFTTSSVYLTNLYLSENTYWALQDVKTGEMVVDFDENYTKLSADSIGNYFTLYTSGLEINRYYRLLIKTHIYSTTFGPLSIYNNEQTIYNALSLYSSEDLRLLPAEEVTYTGQNLIFKIVA